MVRSDILSIVVLLGLANVADAGLVAPQSPSDLASLADDVVIGTAGSIAQAGANVTFSLHIDRVLKGAPFLAGSTVVVQWQMPSVSDAQLLAEPTEASNSGMSGMWFLRDSSGGLVLVPAAAGEPHFTAACFPAAAGPILSAYAYPSSASLPDMVAAELGSAIESSGGTYNTLLFALESGLLDKLNSPYVTLLFTRLSASSSVSQKIIGLSGLIRSGNAGALGTAAGSSSSFAAYSSEMGILLFSVRNYFRSSDASAVSALGGVATGATTSTTALREAAAHALASIHTATALPYLVDLLGDQNVALRVEAIGGIGSFANGLTMQTLDNTASLAYLQYPASATYMTADTKANFALGTQAIERNETAYLSFWTQWWTQHRTALGF
jgi:hypothetical protein